MDFFEGIDGICANLINYIDLSERSWTDFRTYHILGTYFKTSEIHIRWNSYYTIYKMMLVPLFVVSCFNSWKYLIIVNYDHKSKSQQIIGSFISLILINKLRIQITCIILIYNGKQTSSGNTNTFIMYWLYAESWPLLNQAHHSIFR